MQPSDELPAGDRKSWMRPGGISLWLWPPFVAMPLLLFGGIYWFPACYFSRERDPLLTTLLGLGLTATVCIVGFLSDPSMPRFGVAIAAAWLLLLLRRALGPIGHNLERFAPVHMFTLLSAIVILDRSPG
jgi:hypothetical protein